MGRNHPNAFIFFLSPWFVRQAGYEKVKTKSNQITVPELKELTDYLEHQIINSYNKIWKVLNSDLNYKGSSPCFGEVEGSIME